MMRSEETALTNSHRSDTADIRSCSSDSTGSVTLPEDIADAPPLQTGWALRKPRSKVRFTPKVKKYLSLGERSGSNAAQRSGYGRDITGP